MIIKIHIQQNRKISLKSKSSPPYSPEIISIQFFGATFLEDSLAPRVSLDLKILVWIQKPQNTLMKKAG